MIIHGHDHDSNLGTCQNCRYFIAVYGVSAGSAAFTVTAQSLSSTELLVYRYLCILVLFVPENISGSAAFVTAQSLSCTELLVYIFMYFSNIRPGKYFFYSCICKCTIHFLHLIIGAYIYVYSSRQLYFYVCYCHRMVSQCLAGWLEIHFHIIRLMFKTVTVFFMYQSHQRMN